MKKLMRGVALSVVALIGLVPINATPAVAFAGSLDVSPESTLAVSNSVIRYTATIAPPAAGTEIAADTDGLPIPPDDVVCTTTVARPGSCQWTVKLAQGAKVNYRVYVKDAEPTMGTPCGAGLPMENCDTAETLAQVDTDDTDLVEYEFKNGTLDITEETQSVAPGAPVSLTATIQSTETVPRNLVGNVDAEILGGSPPSPNANQVATGADFECSTTPASCTLTYTTGPNPGVDAIQTWIDLNDDIGDPGDTPPVAADGDETAAPDFEADPNEGRDEATTPGTDVEKDDTDVVDVEISSATPTVNLEPESQPNKTTGTTATITASVTSAGAPQSGVAVAAAFLSGSPNSSATLAGCTTSAGGTCNLTYTGTVVGTDKVRGAIDTDANGQPDIDATEDVTTPGGTVEPDGTDVVSVTYVSPTPGPGPGPGGDDGACEEAKKKLKKAKKNLKKAKKSGDEEKIKKAKKKVKKAKKRKAEACAGA